MSPSQKKRLAVVALVLVGVSLATFLALMSMQSSLEYFKQPSQIISEGYDKNQSYKIAGWVRKGSLTRLEDGVTQRFEVTDCEHHLTIQYTGILPDLFREGQAIVSVGKFDQNTVLIAQQVLAKHDENYVPDEAAEAVMLAQANKCNDAEGPVNY